MFCWCVSVIVAQAVHGGKLQYCLVFSGRPRSILSKNLTAQYMLERILPDYCLYKTDDRNPSPSGRNHAARPAYKRICTGIQQRRNEGPVNVPQILLKLGPPRLEHAPTATAGGHKRLITLEHEIACRA